MKVYHKRGGNATNFRWIRLPFCALLAVMALVFEPWRTRLLAVVFAVWCIWLAATLLRPHLPGRKSRAYAGRRNRASADRSGPQMEDVLVRHVNYRISA